MQLAGEVAACGGDGTQLVESKYARGLLSLMATQLSVLVVDFKFYKKEAVWEVVKNGIAPILDTLVREEGNHKLNGEWREAVADCASIVDKALTGGNGAFIDSASGLFEASNLSHYNCTAILTMYTIYFTPFILPRRVRGPFLRERGPRGSVR